MRKCFFVMIMAASLCSFRRGPENTNTRVEQAAKSKLSSFLASIPAGSEQQFGMKNREEINSAVVGTPYHVLVLAKDFYSVPVLAGNNYTKYVAESNEWRVPVKVRGEARLLMTVNSNAGSYIAGDMGGADLARELQLSAGKAQKNHTYYILRVYQLTSDFLVDAPGNSITNARIIPLASARMAMPGLKSRKEGYSLAQALGAIKEKLNSNPKN